MKYFESVDAKEADASTKEVPRVKAYNQRKLKELIEMDKDIVPGVYGRLKVRTSM